MLLKHLSNNSVVFCELVEHPGGHDGGEFPQYHCFYDDKYVTDLPECPNDSFCDEDIEDYFLVSDKAEARQAVINAFTGIGVPESAYAGWLKAFDESTEEFKVEQSE